MNPPTALFEHSFYIGSYLSGILYGIEFLTYILAAGQFYRRSPYQRSWRLLFCYNTALFILSTTDVAANAAWGEILWIHKRNNPGVPTFIKDEHSVWYLVLGTSAAVAVTLLSNGLMIYRLYDLWRPSLRVLILPVLMHCASIALGILKLISEFDANGSLAGKANNVGIAYYSVTGGLSVLATTLICIRLLMLSKRMREGLIIQRAKQTTGLADILIESAVPFSFLGILLIPFYAAQQFTAVALVQVYSQVACLSAQLIVLRILRGKAWNGSVITQIRSGAWWGFDPSGDSPCSSGDVSVIRFSERDQGSLSEEAKFKLKDALAVRKQAPSIDVITEKA